MGTLKIKKRISLQKQFAVTFVLILALSIITASLFIAFLYHSINAKGNNSFEHYDKAKITSLIKYVDRYGISISNKIHRTQLKRIIGSDAVGFCITDNSKNILYDSTDDCWNQRPGDFIIQRINHCERDFHPASNIYIPIRDKNSGNYNGALILTFDKEIKNVSFILIEFVIIPFVCFTIYALIFTGVLSQKIRKPLRELMNATLKIKDRDLNFTIKNDQDNEIGDLARALEEMRLELKSSLVRGWQLEQDRHDMVAALTHDLKTPLAIIHGHIEGLQEGIKNNPEKLAGYLKTIEQNTTRVINLVDEMNLFVEVDSVDFDINPHSANLKEFLKNKTNDLQILAHKKRIRIDSEIISSPDLKNWVFPLDANRLAQVIDNIIDNSIRFTPPGGFIKITVYLEETQIRITICDNGPGFTEKDLPNLFKKFYKGDYSRSIEKSHSGLGLYIAKSIIEKHGGTIKASNRPEGGACIEFTIDSSKNVL